MRDTPPPKKNLIRFGQIGEITEFDPKIAEICVLAEDTHAWLETWILEFLADFLFDEVESFCFGGVEL